MNCLDVLGARKPCHNTLRLSPSHLPPPSTSPPGTRVSTKAVMIHWLQSILPEWKISNLNTDWNDGRSDDHPQISIMLCITITNSKSHRKVYKLYIAWSKHCVYMSSFSWGHLYILFTCIYELWYKSHTAIAMVIFAVVILVTLPEFTSLAKSYMPL